MKVGFSLKFLINIDDEQTNVHISLDNHASNALGSRKMSSTNNQIDTKGSAAALNQGVQYNVGNLSQPCTETTSLQKKKSFAHIPAVAIQRPKLAKPAVSGNVDQAGAFMSNYKKGQNVTEGKSKLPMIQILKLISSIYVDRIRLKPSNTGTIQSQSNQPLYLTLFELYLHRFGVRKMAENKLKDIIDAARYYSIKCRRIKLFARFLGVVEPSLDNDDFNLYIDCFKNFDDSFGGINLASSTNDVILIPKFLSR